MGDGAHSKRLRVAGTVVPGSIKRQGTTVEFTLQENDKTLPVIYKGTEAPPDTLPKSNWSGECCGVLKVATELETGVAAGAAGSDDAGDAPGAVRSPRFCGGVGVGVGRAPPLRAIDVCAGAITDSSMVPRRVLQTSIFIAAFLSCVPSHE